MNTMSKASMRACSSASRPFSAIVTATLKFCISLAKTS